MERLKSFIKKLFSTKNLLITLVFAFITLFMAMILFTFSIYIDLRPTFSFTSRGVITFFEIFKYPIAIAASLIAIATLYVATLRSIIGDRQVIEMRSQREASYQPDIAIERRKIFIRTGTGKPIIENSRIIGKNDEQFLEINNDVNGDKEPNLILHNIGRGVAKNFRYRFTYDVNTCIQLMNKFKVNDYFVMLSKNNYVEILTKGTPQARFSGVIPNESWNSKVDFILPIGESTSPTQILMPYLYILLNFIKDELHLRSRREINDPNSILSQFPKLIFECEYIDIGLKQHKKKIELKFQFMIFRQMLDGNDRFNNITYEYDLLPLEFTD